MVSFQAPFPDLTQTNTTHRQSDTTNSNKKRKWDHDSQPPKDILPFKHWATTPHKAAPIPIATTKYFSDIELHLETPLPSEWQRCLNIQSGEIHFYNTRTQKRTARDPREESSEEPTSPSPRPRDCHMSLDLELNLPCGSRNHNNYSSSDETKHVTTTMKKKSSSSPTTTTSPPSTPTHHRFKTSLNNTIIEKNFFENLKVEDDEESAAAATTEMMAVACMRCHMLVMLQKSSPTCPNCKFVHPPYHSPPGLFNPTLSLSC